MRRILANLLAEDELAGRRATPARPVLETVARMAGLLRVFAREGDRLWSPGSPGPELESGPLEDLPPAGEVLAWCETPAALAHRGGPRPPAPLDWSAPLHELLWRLPTPPPSVVATVHHRAFQLQIAGEIGCALPGARWVTSLADLESQPLPPSWVVKAPLSAAGRDRHVERSEAGLGEPRTRRTVERLFARHGSLLLEPWLDRMADYGVSALLTRDHLHLVGLHGQRIDRRGQFLGIDLQPELSRGDRDRLVEVTGAVGSALRKEGYVGPFGLDAWSYRSLDGRTVFHPLGEINARMTFGLVAWAWAGRTGKNPLA